MDLKSIMTGMFPIQSVTSDLAAGGQLGILPQMMSGMDEDAQMGLMGFLGPQFLGGGQDGQSQTDPYASMRPQEFLTQTPGSPSAPGRVDQTSFGGQGMDPMAMLEANIMRRFGGQ